MAAKKEVQEEVVEEVKVKPAKKTTAKKVVEENETIKKAEPKKAAKKVAEKKEVKEEVESKPAKKATKKVPKDKTVQFWGTGRRKKSVARVRIMQGNGKFIINGRDIEEYLPLDTLKLIVRQPLVLTDTVGKYDVICNVHGGGYTGQTGAIRHGIARALVKDNETYKAELKKAGFLSRDYRQKERKKYGLKKARKAPQVSRR